MRTKLLLQLTLLLMVLVVTTSEGFFFEYPKKVITDFLQSIKEKKEAKKKPDVHHYHVHYYPVLYPFSETPVKAPEKHELEEIHNEHLAALGWSKHEYQYVPEPKLRSTSSLFDIWKDVAPWEYEISGKTLRISRQDCIDENKIFRGDTDFLETVKHSENEGIYVQIPVHQKIYSEYPHTHKKLKISNLLSSLFYKILESKNSIHS